MKNLEQIIIVTVVSTFLSTGVGQAQTTDNNSDTLNGVIEYSNADDYAGSIDYDKFRDEQSAYLLRASDLIGAEVYDKGNVSIGDIDDLVLDRESNTVHAVISAGGLLGMGDQLITLPYNKLRISADGQSVYLSYTQDELAALEGFSYNQGESSGRETFRSRRAYLQSLSE